jgi:Cyclic nucleotide-binding domain.
MDVSLILSHSQLFEDIKSESIKPLLNCLNPHIKSYTKQEYILSMGDTIPGIGLVLDGTVQILKEDLEANRVIMDHITPGYMFAESFVCAGFLKSMVYAQAVTNCRIMWFDLQKIVTACSSSCEFHHQLIANLLKITAQKSIFLNTKIDILSKKTIREKTLSYLTSVSYQMAQKKFVIPFDRAQMADFLCIDRSALSRELSRMKEEGIIDYHKNTFTLKN